MEILPVVLLVLFPALLIVIVVVLRRLRREQPAPVLLTEHEESGPEASPGGPRPQQAHLETLRLAAEQMETEHIENLLGMGATLKPGAEDIFRQELAKRDPLEDQSEKP